MGCYIYGYCMKENRPKRIHVKCENCLGSHECPKSKYYVKDIDDYEGDIGRATALETERQNNG